LLLAFSCRMQTEEPLQIRLRELLLIVKSPDQTRAFTTFSAHLQTFCAVEIYSIVIIDRVAGAIIRLVASVCVCVCPSVCLWALSCLNRSTFDFDFWHEGRKLFTLTRLNQWCGAGRY